MGETREYVMCPRGWIETSFERVVHVDMHGVENKEIAITRRKHIQ
jgi:hypothetical protein